MRRGQSVVEYVLLVAVTVTALVVLDFIFKPQGGPTVFENHFQAAFGPYFKSGGVSPSG